MAETTPTAPPAPMLHGVKVVDLTQYLSGPTVTRLMAELGADVVKVEQAPHGDPSRTLGISTDGRSGYLVQQNRGKRSVCLDFDTPDGREILDRLIADADVLVENYGPNVLEKRGLGYDAVHERHPKLVYASISGFGRTGSYSHKTCFDLIAQSYSGLMHLTGEADGPPMPVSAAYADVSAGVHAFGAVGMALFHRERTGVGTHIDIAMIDTLFHMNDMAVQGSSITKGRWRPRRNGRFSMMNAPQGVYHGPDGWITVHVMASQWESFCRVIRRPELITDERFASLAGRSRNRDALNAIVESAMGEFDSDEQLLAALEAGRIPCAPVIDPADAHEHPYFVERGMVRTVKDPLLGEMRVPGNPMRFSVMPEALDLVAPMLGEHNGEVLAALGYSVADVERLTSSGVLSSNDR